MRDIYIKINEGSFFLASSEFIEIKEGDYIQFRVKTDEPGSYSVQIGDNSIELSLNPAACYSSNIAFDSMSFQYFRGFIGHTTAELIAGEEIRSCAEYKFNVLATKLTSDRAVSFLRFIASNKDFSVPYLDFNEGGAGKGGDIDAYSLGAACLESIERHWSKLFSDPYKGEMRTAASSSGASEEEVFRLATDSQYWEKGTRRDCDITSKNGIPLKAVSGSVIADKEDLVSPENIMIARFLVDFSRYLSESSVSSLPEIPLDFNSNEVSIDQVLKAAGIVPDIRSLKIKSKVDGLLSKFMMKTGMHRSRNFDVNLSRLRSKKGHYNEIISRIGHFFKKRNESLGKEYLFGLKNMPKMFEYVCLMQLVDGLKRRGFKLEDFKVVSEDNSNMLISDYQEYNFSRGDESLTLFYDKRAKALFELKEDDVLGTTVDIKHGSNWTWRPDFCLIHHHPDKPGRPNVHIMDAKYTTEEVALLKRLPNLAQKYLAYLKVLRRDEAGELTLIGADSLILLYSDKDTLVNLTNERAIQSTPSFIGKSASLPLVGVMGVTERLTPNVEYMLDKLDI